MVRHRSPIDLYIHVTTRGHVRQMRIREARSHGCERHVCASIAVNVTIVRMVSIVARTNRLSVYSRRHESGFSRRGHAAEEHYA